jgi:hypothetical protein
VSPAVVDPLPYSYRHSNIVPHRRRDSQDRLTATDSGYITVCWNKIPELSKAFSMLYPCYYERGRILTRLVFMLTVFMSIEGFWDFLFSISVNDKILKETLNGGYSQMQ